MAQRDPERYTQGDDGLIAEKVGSWAVDKLKIVTDYVYASGGARKKYARTGAAYIDPFCGPGRSLIRDTTKFIDGSPVAAFKRALESPGRFTSINISDGDDDLMDAATKRLIALDAPVRRFAGPASVAMPEIVQSLDRHGLHLAFLDPYNLGTLSFDLFVELAKLKRIDVIAHVSLHDLQRNAGRYTSEAHDQFDKFAPGWREKAGTNMVRIISSSARPVIQGGQRTIGKRALDAAFDGLMMHANHLPDREERRFLAIREQHVCPLHSTRRFASQAQRQPAAR